jgi:mono/diheme cytochrome c family protein
LIVISEHSKLPLNDEKTEKPSKKITSFNIELSHMNLNINKSRMDAFQKAYDEGNENQRKGILTYMSTINKKQLSIFLMSK